MSEQRENRASAAPHAPEPHPRLRDLDVLEGTWRLEGFDPATGVPFTGLVVREWLPGGFFLTQRTETDGHPQADSQADSQAAPQAGIVALEYIGYDSTTDTLRSMLFSDEGPGPFCPFALEYFWDIDGDRLTIWHGFRESPAKFTGVIDRDAQQVAGAWEWPGGGYEATTTRVA